MNFGPAEMAQMMDGAKGLITVAIVSSVGIGIVLGTIIGLYRILFRHRAADQSFQSEMPTDPALPTVPVLPNIHAQEIDATTPYRPRSPVPRANNPLRLVNRLGIFILIAIAGGGFFSYYTSKRSDFKATYDNDLGIEPSPPAVEHEPPPPAVEPEQQVREAATRADSINANLCEASSRHAIERTLSSAPT